MKKILFALIALLAGCAGCAQQTRYATVDNEQFARVMTDPAIQVVDVRTPAEFAGGHIQGAVNMDVKNPRFDEQAKALDKRSPVAVYCRSGVRSRTAAARLAELGYEVYNLEGGIAGWNGAVVH